MIEQDVATLAKRGVAVVALLFAMGLLASYCTARRVERDVQRAQQTAERDSARARARRHETVAREHLVAANARAFKADSLATIARHSADAADTHRALLTIDRATLPAAITEQMRLDSLAIADSRLVAPAYHVAIEEYRPAVEVALVGLDESRRADTLSQALGAAATTAAHRRGVAQGIKGTVLVEAALVVVGVALHLGGKL